MVYARHKPYHSHHVKVSPGGLKDETLFIVSDSVGLQRTRHSHGFAYFLKGGRLLYNVLAFGEVTMVRIVCFNP